MSTPLLPCPPGVHVKVLVTVTVVVVALIGGIDVGVAIIAHVPVVFGGQAFGGTGGVGSTTEQFVP